MVCKNDYFEFSVCINLLHKLTRSASPPLFQTHLVLPQRAFMKNNIYYTLTNCISDAVFLLNVPPLNHTTNNPLTACQQQLSSKVTLPPLVLKKVYASHLIWVHVFCMATLTLCVSLQCIPITTSQIPGLNNTIYYYSMHPNRLKRETFLQG